MKKLFKILMIIMLIIVGILSYAYFIEPHRLVSKEVNIPTKFENGKTLKIVQFSDLHIKEKTTSDDLNKLVNKINQAKPDVIIFTGDLYDNYSVYHDDEKISHYLKEMKAKYAKVAVYGNHDSGGGGRWPYQLLMKNAGFKLLVNDSYSFTFDDKKVVLYGLDDFLLGNPYWQENNGDYKVLITHEPEMDYQTDENLVLSGHTHGGQVRLPFLSGKTNLMGSYVCGLYKEKNQYHYIDSGLGTTRLPFRLGVTPQISILKIKI